ncbi:MAG: glycosyltransferase [Candidatus Pacebacteria bacterium]|nr:glycosyltransferase [Candidatus Paceibacterota bacterium]
MHDATGKKILMIGWEYPPHNSGGLGVACQGLTRALSQQQTEIYFTLPYNLNGSQASQKQNQEHMKFVSCVDPSWLEEDHKPPFSSYISNLGLRSKQLDRHELRTLPWSELEKKVSRYAQLVEQQAAKIKDQFELIHAHDWMSFPAAAKVKKQTGKPLIAHVHSTEEDRIPTGSGSSFIKKTEQLGMQLADKVVAVSFYTKRVLIEKYDIQPDKIEVVHNGVSPLNYQPQKQAHFAGDRPVIVFMGRLTMQKGAEFFIDVSRQVLAKQPDALFILAGSGDLYQELLFRVSQQGLTASTLFSGFVRGKQKRKLLERADVFVMPSVSEPFGLVALEAAQHQTPVIVSKNSGVSELMKSSIQLDFWDIDLMSQKILQLLSDQGFSRQIVAQQIQDISQASWDNSASKIRQVYHRAFIG